LLARRAPSTTGDGDPRGFPSRKRSGRRARLRRRTSQRSIRRRARSGSAGRTGRRPQPFCTSHQACAANARNPKLWALGRASGRERAAIQGPLFSPCAAPGEARSARSRIPGGSGSSRAPTLDFVKQGSDLLPKCAFFRSAGAGTAAVCAVGEALLLKTCSPGLARETARSGSAGRAGRRPQPFCASHQTARCEGPHRQVLGSRTRFGPRERSHSRPIIFTVRPRQERWSPYRPTMGTFLSADLVHCGAARPSSQCRCVSLGEN